MHTHTLYSACVLCPFFLHQARKTFCCLQEVPDKNVYNYWQQLPLVRSEARVGRWVHMNLFSVNFIQLDGKTCEAVIHVRVGRQRTFKYINIIPI